MLKVQCDREGCQGGNMQMMERQGVEIDYCSMCRGVWLDRGELDKIIERVQAMSGGAAQPQAAPPQQPPMPQQPPPPQQGYPQQPPQQYPPQQGYPQQQPAPGYGQQPPIIVVDDDDYYRHPQHGYQKKKKGWLDDIFDF
jgi:Zn-finger nucleic acid-binding protein